MNRDVSNNSGTNVLGMNFKKINVVFWIKLIVIIICLFATLLYLYFVYMNTPNVPRWDDFEAVLQFIQNVKHDKNITEVLFDFWSQHNEHRILIPRLIFFLYFEISGTVDFQKIAFVGNLGWVMSLILLSVYQVKVLKLNWFCCIVTTLIFLSYCHYEIMNWAMASVQQYFQILFVIILLLVVSQYPRSIVGAMLLGICSVSCGGGGLAVLPLVFLIFLLKKNINYALVWGAFSIFLLIIYFYGYAKPAHHPSVLGALENPINLVKFVFCFLGSSMPSVLSAMCLGIVLFIGIVININYIYKNVFLFLLTMFIFATALMVSLTRSGFGVDYAISSRYSIYSLLAINVFFVALLLNEKLKKCIWYLIAFEIVSSSFLYVYWYCHGSEALDTSAKVVSFQPYYPSYNHAVSILRKMKAEGIYNAFDIERIDNAYKIKNIIDNPNLACLNVLGKVEYCKNGVNGNHNILQVIVDDNTRIITVDGWAVDEMNNDRLCGIYAILDEQRYHTLLVPRFDVANAFDNPNFAISGFGFVIDVSNLKDGDHLLEIRSISHDCKTVYRTAGFVVHK